MNLPIIFLAIIAIVLGLYQEPILHLFSFVVMGIYNCFSIPNKRVDKGTEIL